MGQVVQFKGSPSQWPAATWVTINGPGWEKRISPAELAPFVAHLRAVRKGERRDPIFSKLTVKELEAVIESIEARIELGVN
jgi:hypothetical protein